MSDDLVPFPPPPQGVYLVGFRLDPRAEGAQFYTLVSLEGDSERPITREGRILFFHNPQDAARALALAGPEFPRLSQPQAEVEMLCDLAHTLYVVHSLDEDEEGVLFDTIACLDDLLHAIEISVPAQYGKILAGLSRALDKGPKFAEWLTIQEIPRESVEDALLWCIGAVAVKGSWV
jgi:hypothetical protein